MGGAEAHVEYEDGAWLVEQDLVTCSVWVDTIISPICECDAGSLPVWQESN